MTESEADDSYEFVMSALIPDCSVDVDGIEIFLAAEKAAGQIPAETRVDQVANLTLAPEAARAMGAQR